MVKAKKDKDDGGASSEEQASARESKRLQDLAVSRGLLSRSKANPSAPLLPTKTIRKCDGKDIVKKGNRKTKYLFAFPGLVASIAGGKFGDLTHLDSRNPTFYVDFPHGRLKLFGTIVYPKNKYLTMHFLPGRGDIVCEDCFESIVVFPEAWWIGTKEENPEELRLTMPSNLEQEKHADVDFTAGAGLASDSNVAAGVPKAAATVKNDPDSPVEQFQVERLQESPSSMDIAAEDVALRRSSRKSAEKLNYFSSPGNSEESSECASESSDYKRKGRRRSVANRDTVQSTSSVSLTDVTTEDKVQDGALEQKSAIPTTAENETGTLLSSSGAEVPQIPGAIASKGFLKQATLTSFLTKTDAVKGPAVEVIEIEESPQKANPGNGGISKRPRRPSRKIVGEGSDDAESSQEDGQSSSDSALKKSAGSRRGRGRGRGRGGRNTAASGGRKSTPTKGDTKRRQSITQLSSSDEDDRPKTDHTRSVDSL